MDALLLLNCNSQVTPKFSPSTAHHDLDFDDYTQSGDKSPLPIDTACFRGINAVRRLVEEASDLATRATSGLLSAAAGAFGQRNGGAYDDLFGSNAGSMSSRHTSRSQMMSPTRQLRLRIMAVSKLADAYRIDEVATAVAVMQGSTALDDVAERVLRQEPNNADARYVHFFHEKIPSRTLPQSSPTDVLDLLIAQNPNQLEYYRTKSVMHTARHEFTDATGTLTHAILLAQNARNAKSNKHLHLVDGNHQSRAKGRGKKGKAVKEDNKTPPSESAPENGSVPALEEAAAVGHEAGDDIERQLLFHRGMAYFHQAFSCLEEHILELEGVTKLATSLSHEGSESTLEAIGIKGLNISGLVGSSRPRLSSVLERYSEALCDKELKVRVNDLFSNAIRDHEHFLAYFPLYQPRMDTVAVQDRNISPLPKVKKDDKIADYHLKRLMQHRSLEGRTRYTHPLSSIAEAAPPIFTTYHPFL